ncbi:MAG: hypothetical protein VX609_09080 [Verrucomicrobiota bacterium]|nr:hypothetical protein [Verrucomicrobiota bacterium]
MKDKFTLPNILFGIFAIIIIGLGIRKFLQNHEEIDRWDAENERRILEMKAFYEEFEKNSSVR